MDKFCMKCGNKIHEGEAFCSKCGYKEGDPDKECNEINSQKTSENNESMGKKHTIKKPKNFKKIVIALILLFVVVGGSLGGYFVYENYQKQKEEELAIQQKQDEQAEREREELARLKKEKAEREEILKKQVSYDSLALIGLAKDSEEFSTLLINSLGVDINEFKKSMGYENEVISCEESQCYIDGFNIGVDGSTIVSIELLEGGPVAGKSGYDLSAYGVISQNGVSTETCVNKLGKKIYIEYHCNSLIEINYLKIYMSLV